MLFGVQGLDPDWMLEQFGSGFLWVSLAVIVVECAVLPFLPGHTLLVTIGVFLDGEKLSILPGSPLLDLAVACPLLVGAATLAMSWGSRSATSWDR